MNSINKTAHFSPQGGFALLLALIVTSVALAIGLSLLDVTVKQIALSATTRESEIAFQAAAAGMDCLVFARSHYPANTQAPGGTVDIDCLNQSTSVSDTNSDDKTQFFSDEFDWTLPSGQNVCINFTMAVIDATAGAETFDQPNGAGLKTCADGRICTYAYSRGYNRDCTEAGTGNLFLVQRELTAEF